MLAKSPLASHRVSGWPTVGIMILAGCAPSALADVRLPSIFGEHLVLQQGKPNPVWGWAEPGEQVAVTIAGQSHAVTCSPAGTWRVLLDSLPAGGPHELVVQGANVIRRDDVLVGEVWIVSGDSSSTVLVERVRDADLEVPAANFPRIRLIKIPPAGKEQAQDDFEGEWTVCSPASVSQFPALGYFFARQLQQTIDVPLGLIDGGSDGSTCEAWIRRDVLAADARYEPLLASYLELETAAGRKPGETASDDKDPSRVEEKPRSIKGRTGKRGGKPSEKPANKPDEPSPPGSLYNGVLRPILGYGMRGAIWYQGPANVARAHQYQHLFPLLIQHWRDEWGQGDFPFYWVQLAAAAGGRGAGGSTTAASKAVPPRDSAWAELREAQTRTLAKLPNTGEAVIVDLGPADQIHPHSTQEVARRLARWALAREYGVPVSHESPRYESHQQVENKIVIRFSGPRDRSLALRTSDGAQPVGLAIAGDDRKFVWAQARIAGNNRVEVWSDDVANPKAVRYAWDDHPFGNLQSRAGLPLTPFRTDDWPGLTEDEQK